jgi:hypothetical protein
MALVKGLKQTNQMTKSPLTRHLQTSADLGTYHVAHQLESDEKTYIVLYYVVWSKGRYERYGRYTRNRNVRMIVAIWLRNFSFKSLFL